MDSVSITFILDGYIHPDADSKDALYAHVYLYIITEMYVCIYVCMYVLYFV